MPDTAIDHEIAQESGYSVKALQRKRQRGVLTEADIGRLKDMEDIIILYGDEEKKLIIKLIDLMEKT